MTDDRRGGGQVERSGLAELGRIQEELERARQRRQAASEAYDSFLGSFGGKPAAAPVPPGRGGVSRSSPRPPGRQVAARAEVSGPALTGAGGIPQASSARPRPRSWQAHAGWLVMAVLAVAAIAALLFAGGRPAIPGAGEGHQPGAAEVAPPLDAAATGGAADRGAGGDAADAAPGAGAAGVGATELVTSRHVWVRVTVDGERVLERELPPGARIPLSARQEIVVRAGDAGAVRVSVRGRDEGPVGGDGQVVTRAFPVP
jgi:hypothetical protein